MRDTDFIVLYRHIDMWFLKFLRYFQSKKLEPNRVLL